MSSRTSRAPRRRSRSDAKPETVGSLARFTLILLICAWALRSFIVQPFYIPSGSMLPTLDIGDYLIVAKWPYGYSRYSFPFRFPAFGGRVLSRAPSRGDVVVFHNAAEDADLIKRVIGLPGDTVAVRRGHLILNGKPAARSPLPPVQVAVSPNSPCKAAPGVVPTLIDRSGRRYCVYRAFLETLPGGPSYTVLDQLAHGPADDFGPVAVPPDRVFVMGDNRDDSLDSRFPPFEGGVGMLPIDNLIGRALVTFWSTDGSSSYLKPWTWFTALRSSRIGNGYTGDAE